MALTSHWAGDKKRYTSTGRGRERGRLAPLLFSEAARPLRFVLTGGLAALIQLGLLALLTHRGWDSYLANALAFLLAAQVNFALSSLFTWRDRPAVRPLWRRWLLFHGSIAGMAVVNMLAFALARTALPPLPASAVGIGLAALGNFFLGDRLVFRDSTTAPRAHNANRQGSAA